MKIDYKLKFGSKLRKYRLINGISPEDFAAKLSISRGTLINYEKGHTKPSVDFILKIKSIYIDFDSEEPHTFQMRTRAAFARADSGLTSRITITKNNEPKADKYIQPFVVTEYLIKV